MVCPFDTALLFPEPSSTTSRKKNVAFLRALSSLAGVLSIRTVEPKLNKASLKVTAQVLKP